MMNPTRMSPITALVFGIFGLGAVGITAASSVVIYGMNVINKNASILLGFTGEVVQDLPALAESIPILADALGGRRAPSYVENVSVDLEFIRHLKSNRIRPVVHVTNRGSEVVSMLAIRVATMDERGRMLGASNELVATPYAFDGDWRGPLMPGETRHIRMSSYNGDSIEDVKKLVGDVEISELRLWQPNEVF